MKMEIINIVMFCLTIVNTAFIYLILKKLESFGIRSESNEDVEK